jgi:hypothetical protein
MTLNLLRMHHSTNQPARSTGTALWSGRKKNHGLVSGWDRHFTLQRLSETSFVTVCVQFLRDKEAGTQSPSCTLVKKLPVTPKQDGQE